MFWIGRYHIFLPHHEGSYLLGGLRIRVDLLICGLSCLSLGEDEGCSDDGIEVEKSRSSKLSNSSAGETPVILCDVIR